MNVYNATPPVQESGMEASLNFDVENVHPRRTIWQASEAASYWVVVRSETTRLGVYSK